MHIDSIKILSQLLNGWVTDFSSIQKKSVVWLIKRSDMVKGVDMFTPKIVTNIYFTDQSNNILMCCQVSRI